MKKIILGFVFLGLFLIGLHACKDDPEMEPDDNSPPTNVMITSTSVLENEPSGTLVGVLSTTDSDDSDTHTYSLVSGEGDADNASFSIDGANVNTNAVFNYESDSIYTIRVQTEDNAGETFQRDFIILILNVNEIDIPFITTWETTSANESITIPTTGGGYNYTVNWGDGTTESRFTGDASHTYATAGTYTVEIAGSAFPRIYFNSNEDRNKIQSIEQWGDIEWLSMESAFQNCNNLISNAGDAPNLSNVTDMRFMFADASSFNSNISSWDVSNVTDMSAMFQGASAFNQDLSSWDVSKVTDIRSMFTCASAFNQDLSSWDVSKVTDMRGMFAEASSFNGNISSWDVSKVTDMRGMFAEASSFNGNISSWDVSKVTDMNFMFLRGSVFNQDLNSWDVSKVRNMSFMFADASDFNGNISSWDVSNVTDMEYMFFGASTFNQDLSTWDVSNVRDMKDMFTNITLSTKNYNALLIAWSALTLRNRVPFGAGNSQYSAGAAATARQSIIDTYGWTISDGGEL